MNDSRALIARNAELETELRLVKEQLDQANNTILYLLNHVGVKAARQDQAIAQDGSRSEKAVNTKRDSPFNQSPTPAANGRSLLNSRLTTQQRFLKRNTQVLRPTEKYRRYNHGSKSLVEEPKKQSGPEVDLLSFDAEHGCTASPNSLIDTPLEAAAVPKTSSHISKSPQVRNGNKQAHGSGILTVCDLNYARQSQIASNSQPHFQQHSGFSFETSNGVGRPIQIPPPQSIQSYPVIEAALPVQFTDNEHNRLMGAACFIETQTAEEQRRQWERYAKQNPRHSGKDWQDYYELRVRPAYYSRAREEPSEVTRDPCVQDENINSYTFEAHNNIKLSTNTDNSCKDGPPDPSVQEEENHELQPEPAQDKEPSRSSENQSLVKPSRLSVPRVSLNVTKPIHPTPQEAGEVFFNPIELKDHHRTVLLLNILQGTIEDMIQRYGVPRAKLVRASVLRTAKMKTQPPMSTDTALLVFVTTQAAKAFVDSTNSQSEAQEASKHCSNYTKARAVHIETPSRILPLWFLELSADPHSQSFLHDCSNVLCLHDDSKQVIDRVNLDATIRRLRSSVNDLRKPVSSHFTEDGTLLLRYVCVLHAMRAYDSLCRSFARHSGQRIGFWTDALKNTNIHGQENSGRTNIETECQSFTQRDDT